jgi:hypothetical protein
MNLTHIMLKLIRTNDSSGHVERTLNESNPATDNILLIVLIGNEGQGSAHI